MACKVTGLNNSGFFTLWGFDKNIVYEPPMPISVEKLKIRISQAML
jgi:hypothetical protein